MIIAECHDEGAFDFESASLAYLTRLDSLLGLSTLSESVLEFACHGLHVSHATCSCGAASLGFLAPVVLPHLLSWVSA